MRNALRETLVLWVSLLIVSGLTLFVLQTDRARGWMWQQTGEEAFLAQVKGLSDLAADSVRPRLDLAEEVNVAFADVVPYGINVFLEQEAELAKRELAVQMAHDAGFRWLRQEFPWEDIEIHAKGDFEDRRHEPYRSAWEKYDHIVELAEQYEMELIVRLSNPPAWTRASGNDPSTYAPPDDFADFADFARAVAERYGDRVRFYQLWNEPNTALEWGNQPISPERYTELLRLGAEAIRAADDDAVILAAALAATIDLQPEEPYKANNLNDLLFLQRMYDAGAADYFDIVSVQGYGLWSGPTDRRMNPRVMNISRPRFVRDLMVQNGDAEKPIWIAEMNWNASPTDWDATFGHVTLAQQATYLPLAFERIEEWPWMGVAAVWFLKRATDQEEIDRNPKTHFRLLKPDFTPLPVYDAMRAYAGDDG